jgi:putative ABC transport system permease protein
MYILVNSLKNLTRNKGRNLLLSVIILAMVVTTVVTLSITHTSDRIIDDYRQSFGSRVMISPDIDAVQEALRDVVPIAGVPAEIPAITPQQSLAFTRSQYVRDYSISATHFAANDDLAAVDGNVESPPMRMADGSEMMTADDGVIMPTFRIIGGAWNDDFDAGQRQISEGRMPQADNEAIISLEVAELNNLSVGDVIRLDSNLTTNGEIRIISRNLTIVGIYFDMTVNPFEGLIRAPMLNRRNEVLTTLDTILANIGENDSGFSISSTFYLHDPSYLAAFEAEARSLGLDAMLLVHTNEAEYNAIVAPVEGLRQVAQTFLLVVLILGGIVLMILSSIAIRERKYEIGVLRAMGMKKHKVAVGLWAEMFALTVICLALGLSAGSVISQPVSDTLLAAQLENLTENNGGAQLGSLPVGGTLTLDITGESYTPLDALDISIGLGTILEIIGISLLITTLAVLVTIIKITKYEPIKILMERN